MNKNLKMNELNCRKYIANVVGADASVRPQKQNGITLIALVITIIVMLILVGVTVSIAINGGLFGTAKSAVSQTELELAKEQLQTAIVASYNVEARRNKLRNIRCKFTRRVYWRKWYIYNFKRE